LRTDDLAFQERLKVPAQNEPPAADLAIEQLAAPHVVIEHVPAQAGEFDHFGYAVRQSLARWR
jgi:hypothetical protein